MAFEMAVGQNRVKAIISRALERGMLAHAYLFYGQPGTGKDAMAISLARGLNCSTDPLGGCGSCKSCRAVMNAEQPGFFPVLPAPSRPKAMNEEKYFEILADRRRSRIQNPYRPLNYLPELSTAPYISIDQIREMKSQVMLRPSSDKNRVFFLSGVEAMNPEASNSLLKLLEEPPPKTMLILTTSFPGNVMRTILSRCQQIRFDPLKEEDIAEAMVNRWQVERQKARFFARMSGGSLQRALDFLDEDFEKRRDMAEAFLDASLSSEAAERIAGAVVLLAAAENTAATEILQLMQIWLRDLVLLQSGITDTLINMDRLDRLKRFHTKWPALDLEKGLAVVEGAIDYIQKNVYLQLVIFSLSGKLNACI